MDSVTDIRKDNKIQKRNRYATDVEEIYDEADEGLYDRTALCGREIFL